MLSIPLNIKAEKLPEFIQHLCVELGAKGHLGGGEYYAEGQDSVEKVFWTPSTAGSETTRIILTLIKKPDGTPKTLDADVQGEPPDDWEKLVLLVVNSALAATINEERRKFFGRHRFAYIGPPLDGEYYISKVRIAPAVHPDTKGPVEERVLYLDLNSEGVDEEHAHAEGKARARQMAALFSVFLDVGLYEIPFEHRWVYVPSGTCERRQLGFTTQDPRPSRMPKKGKQCPAGAMRNVKRSHYKKEEFHRLVLDHHQPKQTLMCPSDIRLLFRTFNSLISDEKKAYLQAAFLYRFARIVARCHPSVGMTYQAAAVDALLSGKKRNAEAFDEMVAEHCSEAGTGVGKEIYEKIRCAHIHGGSFPGGEYDPTIIWPFRMSEELSRLDVQWSIHAIMHTVLIRWLLSPSHPRQ